VLQSGEITRVDLRSGVHEVDEIFGERVNDRSLTRMDFVPTIRFPFTHWSFLTFNSSASWHDTYWTESLVNNEQVEVPVSRKYYDLSTRMSGPTFSRVWTRTGRGGTQKFKHVIEPSFSVRHSSTFDTYDSIGRYRTQDPEGRTIDPSVTLPPLFNNEAVTDTVAMQNKIAQNPGFTACFSKNMLNWALAEGSQLTPTSCATQAIVTGFNASDKSLSALLREVAISKAFTQRNAGVTQ